MSELEGFLSRLVGLLDQAGIPFMIAGSFASTAHGLPRTTQDLDLVIDPPSRQALDALVYSFSPADYYVDEAAAQDAFRRRSMCTSIFVPTHSLGMPLPFTPDTPPGIISTEPRSSGSVPRARPDTG